MESLERLRRARHRGSGDPELEARYRAAVVRRYGGEARALLSSLSAWRGATPAARDAAGLSVARALGVRWRRLGEARRCSAMTAPITDRFVHRPTGVVMALIPGGWASIGSAEGGAYERPEHRRRLRPFLIAEAPLCAELWSGSSGPAGGEPATDFCWYEAKVWLTRIGDGLRLPREHEWEYACGGSELQRDVWSRDRGAAAKRSWIDRAGCRNGFGLLETLGNVWEICEDRLLDYRTGEPRSEDRPYRFRVARGGSWREPHERCTASARREVSARCRASDIGARFARSLPEAL